MTKNLKRGFTLTELIIVIVIIGILAGVLIPTLSGYVKRSKISAAEQEASGIYTVYATWKQEIDSGATTKGFAAYYTEITEKDLAQLGAWAIKDTPENVPGETNMLYSLSFASAKNKYVVYMDGNGRVLATKPQNS